MFTRLLLALLFAITASWGLNLHLDAQESLPPFKVFILAGQSNMEGKGSVETMRRQLKDPQKQHRFAHLQTEDGDQWAERNDVWIHYLGNRGKRTGKLTVGYGISQKGSQDLFGPELGFGWTLGELLDENILIIKTAWGGKSLDRDFRPPSRGLPQSIDEVVEGQKKTQTRIDERRICQRLWALLSIDDARG